VASGTSRFFNGTMADRRILRGGNRLFVTSSTESIRIRPQKFTKVGTVRIVARRTPSLLEGIVLDWQPEVLLSLLMA